MTTAKNDVLLDYDSKIFCWEVDKNLVGERSLLGWGNSSRWGAGLSKFLTDVGGLSSFPLVEKTLGIPGGLKVKSKLPPCKCFVALTQFIETHSQKAAITFF